MSGLLQEALPAQRVVVAIDPGKVANRVWLASGERGLIGEPVSLPTLRAGVDELVRLIAASASVGKPVIAIEATGSLHGAWTAELERRFPGCVRLLAPSETQAARAQLGSRRFKSDDRDCAALVWLARQGLGRVPDAPALEALLGVVRHRRQLVAELKVLRQRLHDQLNRLCPGLSAPQGHGRTLDLLRPAGRAVLRCLLGPRAHCALVAGARSRPDHAQQCRLLGRALAGLPCSTCRRRPACTAARARPRAA